MFGRAVSASAKTCSDFKQSHGHYDAMQLAGGSPGKGIDCLKKSLGFNVVRLTRGLISSRGYYIWRPEDVSNNADFESPVLCCKFPSCDVKAPDIRLAMIQLGIASYVYALSRRDGSQTIYVKIRKSDLQTLKKAVESLTI